MAMDTQVTLGLVALAGTVAALASPILMSHLTNRNALALKQQDWDRQDEVAKKAEAAAARNASLLAEMSRTQAQTSEVIFGKMDVLHTLSNSTLTAAMQLSLDGMKRELVLMKRDPKINGGATGILAQKIEDMQSVIMERNKQTGVADLQDQRAEALKASQAVGMIVSPLPGVVIPTSSRPSLGEVTERVLRGETISPPAGITAAEAATEQGKAAIATVEAAVATVEAADKTGKAAVKTVEAMKAAPK